MKEKVLEILGEVNADILENADKDLLAAGYIDSFDIVSIVVELEDAFEIEIDPELVIPENFRTVDAITNLISEIVG